jgi:hypothetical protein
MTRDIQRVQLVKPHETFTAVVNMAVAVGVVYYSLKPYKVEEHGRIILDFVGSIREKFNEWNGMATTMRDIWNLPENVTDATCN